MGIRFSCHMCNHSLHVKDFQAGKRGRCPNCKGAFRIPVADSPVSSAIDDALSSPASTLVAEPKTKNTLSRGKSSRSSSSVVAKSKAESSNGSGVHDEHPLSESTNKNSKAPAGLLKKNPKPVADLPPTLMSRLDSKWFVRPPSGGQYGPAPTRMLVDWISERRVTADSLLWCEGMAQWQIANQLVPELFDTGSASPTSAHPTAGTVQAVSLGQELADVSHSDGLTDLLLASPPGDADTSNASVAAHKGSVAIKKKRAMRQQTLVLGGLATVAVILFVALIFVLMNSAASK